MNKYLEYSKERFIQSLKTVKEYKSNLYVFLIGDFFNILVIMIFYNVYMKLSTNSFLDWAIYDFLTYFLIINFSIKFRNSFYFWGFRGFVLRGNFNLLLIRPISTYFQILLNAWKGGRLFSVGIIFSFMFFIVLFGDYSNFIFASIIWLIGFIANICLYNEIAMLGFFISGSYGLEQISRASHEIMKTYTFAPFEGNNILKHILIGLFPMGLVAYVVFQILKGNINYFYDYIFYFIGYLFLMIILNVILWKKGLEKYEAYN